MRNKIKNRYFTSSSKQEKKSFRYKQKDTNFLRYKPKYSTPLRYTPKDTSEKIHICPKYLILCCYLLVSAVLLSTSISFSKYTTSTGLIVEPAKIASFAVDVQKINKSLDDLKSELSLSSTYVKDNDVMVEAFTVSNNKNGISSDVALSCDVQLFLATPLEYNNSANLFAKLGALEKLSLYMIVKSSDEDTPKRFKAINISDPETASIALTTTANIDGQWKDNIKFDKNDIGKEKTYTCIIVFDTSEFEYKNENFNFNPPQADNPNLFVTVDQVD